MTKTKGFLVAVVAATMAFTFSCSSDDGEGGGGGGGCSASNFKTVEIGGQTWTAENLNCNVSGSKCYGDDPANCEKYGRLYTRATANTICPSGWHLPSVAEWVALGSISKLKATSGWSSNGNGTDDYGFSALPGGLGRSDGSFSGIGSGGYWSAAPKNRVEITSEMYSSTDDSDNDCQILNDCRLMSVRCVKN